MAGVQRYSGVAIALHWLVVLLVVVQFLSMWLGDLFDRQDPARDVLFDIHIVSGIAVLLAILVRLWWRRGHKPPPPPAGTGRLMRIAAAAVHHGLYVLLVLQPLLGLGALYVWRGFGEVHEVLANVILVFVGVHVAATLWHQFVLRDGLIRRMLPAG